jgi:hypothetical protein
MPRRPMHLRWIYVKDHAPLFAALAALLVVAVFGSVFLVSDPTRGLLLGVFPSLFGLVVWGLTNRAGYPHRTPEKPAQGLSPSEAPAPAPASGQAVTRRTHKPAPAARPSPPVARSGDPFAGVPLSQPTNPPGGAPPRPRIRQPTITGQPDGSTEEDNPQVAEAKSKPTGPAPGARQQGTALPRVKSVPPRRSASQTQSGEPDTSPDHQAPQPDESVTSRPAPTLETQPGAVPAHSSTEDTAAREATTPAAALTPSTPEQPNPALPPTKPGPLARKPTDPASEQPPAAGEKTAGSARHREQRAATGTAPGSKPTPPLPPQRTAAQPSKPTPPAGKTAGPATNRDPTKKPAGPPSEAGSQQPQPPPSATKPKPNAAGNPAPPAQPKPVKAPARKPAPSQKPAVAADPPAAVGEKELQSRTARSRGQPTAAPPAPGAPVKPPSERAREAAAPKRPAGPADASSNQETPGSPADEPELLSPAEAAKRDAAARKRSAKKRRR